MPWIYVDSFRSGESESSPEHEDQQITLGMPVIVTGGKHQGKQGILSAIKRWIVIVAEDQSEIQVSKLIIRT